jgi:hypothetical protein
MTSDPAPLIYGYTNADWAPSDIDKRRSVLGFVLFLSGGAIVWLTKFGLVCLSIFESEYSSLKELAKNAVAARHLLEELPLSRITQNATHPTTLLTNVEGVSMDLKLHTLQHKRKYWEVVSYPNIVRCHFVNKVKMKQGKVDRYKSRLVVDGCKQVSRIDYKYSFAPVVKYNTLRIFLAIAAVYSMQVHQLDVESAFILPFWSRWFTCIHTLG